MPQWTQAPDPAQQTWAFRILRTPATAVVDAIITCNNVNGCPTHFANHRTVPCEGQPGCQLCDSGHSWRWHGYVSAVLVKTMEHVLFEFTAQASDTFRTYLTVHPTLRGCHFRAHRPAGHTNSRVIIQARAEDLTRIRLPDPPDIRRILCHIWGIQYTEQTDTSTTRPPFRQIRVPSGLPDARYPGGNGHND